VNKIEKDTEPPIFGDPISVQHNVTLIQTKVITLLTLLYLMQTNFVAKWDFDPSSLAAILQCV